MKSNLDFISKLYNNRNSYADIFTDSELRALHIESPIEELIIQCIKNKKVIYITGNPGDGKTHLIRSLKQIIDEYDAYVVKDINEIKDNEKFLEDLKKAIDANNPAIIAINEYPFIELLNQLGERLPDYKSIIYQRKNSIIYNNEVKEFDIHNVVVIDLNNRNLLSPDMTERVLSKLLNLSNKCDGCSSCNGCSSLYNIDALDNDIVKERLLKLTNKIGNSGIHIVMRDILGFFAYLITKGKRCSERENNESKQGLYYDLVFQGDNELFKVIKQFDPYNYTHPEIDENLWKGELTEGWQFDPPEEAPEKLNDHNKANEVFKSIKRKFYFENIRGEELLQLIPDEIGEYYKLLTQAYDRHSEKIKEIVLAINRFFNPNDNDHDRLKIWITHKYELRTNPKVAVASRSFPLDFISLQVPRIPKEFKTMEYVPDHILFKVVNMNNKESVDLKINLNFYRALSLINKGYPAQLIPDEYKFKLFSFMNELASLKDITRSNDFFMRDIINGDSCRVTVKNNKYNFK